MASPEIKNFVPFLLNYRKELPKASASLDYGSCIGWAGEAGFPAKRLNLTAKIIVF